MKVKDPFLQRGINKLEIRVSRLIILEFNKIDFLYGTLGLVSVFGHSFGRNARSYFIDMKAEKTRNNKSKVVKQIVHRAF